jgi:hypothetical protein
MKRLGYTRFVAQGGDWGSPVSNEMGKLAPPELLGIHVNLPGTVPPEILKALQSGDPAPADLADDEQRAFDELKVAIAKRRAYAAFMATRPQTLNGIADSPVGLAAWMIDHGDGRAKLCRDLVTIQRRKGRRAGRSRTSAPDYRWPSTTRHSGR